MARQGEVLPVMNSTNELVLFVDIDFTHIPYAEYLGVKLRRVTER